MSTPAKPPTKPRIEKPTYSSLKEEPYLVVKTIVGEVMPFSQDVWTLRQHCFHTPSTTSATLVAQSHDASAPAAAAAASSSASSSAAHSVTDAAKAVRENEDACAVHVIAYLNISALAAYIEQNEEFTKARSSVGLSTLRFRGQMPDPPQAYLDEAKRILGAQRQGLTETRSASALSGRTSNVPAHIAAAVADGSRLTFNPSATSAAKVTPNGTNKNNNNNATPRYKPPQLHPIGALRLRRVSRCPQLGRFHMMVATVEWQCVLAPYRHSGVGHALLHMAERAASDAFHVPCLYLFSPLSARSFYENQGYVLHLVPPAQPTNALAAGSGSSTATPAGEAMAPVQHCGSNTSQCIAAGWKPRVVTMHGEPHLVMAKSLKPDACTESASTTPSSL